MDGVNLGTALKAVVAEYESRKPELVETARIRRAWERIADASMLEHTDAVFVVPNTDAQDIIVYVDSQIWATELNLQSELLRLKLNLELNEANAPQECDASTPDALFDMSTAEHIKRLRFVPSKEKYARRPRGNAAPVPDAEEDVCPDPVELSHNELSLLEEQVAGIENEKLKKAAFDAARAGLELLKGASS